VGVINARVRSCTAGAAERCTAQFGALNNLEGAGRLATQALPCAPTSRTALPKTIPPRLSSCPIQSPKNSTLPAR
jgi:hypothetical protein